MEDHQIWTKNDDVSPYANVWGRRAKTSDGRVITYFGLDKLNPGEKSPIAAETAMSTAHRDSMGYGRVWKPIHPTHGGATA